MRVPPNIRVISFRTLRAITETYSTCIDITRRTHVFWGTTGTGKSRRARFEAGVDVYPKGATTKFWCGYRGQKHVVMDEFRGAIDIGHLLIWTDRYANRLELKGSSFASSIEQLWITSNLPPERWWPDVDPETYAAFVRRINVVHFTEEWLPPDVINELD